VMHFDNTSMIKALEQKVEQLRKEMGE